jgi:hypothetical protein
VITPAARRQLDDGAQRYSAFVDMRIGELCRLIGMASGLVNQPRSKRAQWDACWKQATSYCELWPLAEFCDCSPA